MKYLSLAAIATAILALTAAPGTARLPNTDPPPRAEAACGPAAGCTSTAPNDAAGGYEGILQASTADPATIAALGDTKGDIPNGVVVKTPAPPATVITKHVDEDGWKYATFALGAVLVGLLGCAGLFMTLTRRREPVPDEYSREPVHDEPEILA